MNDVRVVAESESDVEAIIGEFDENFDRYFPQLERLYERFLDASGAVNVSDITLDIPAAPVP